MKEITSKKKPFHLTLVVSIVAAAAIALISFFYLSVEIVTGTSMSPTIQSGDVLLTVKGLEVERGDEIAFYYGNKVLVRRIIGIQGDWIDIDENGNVFVNDNELDEPYVSQKVSGNGDIEYPYQVPANRYFVLGDNRGVAPDSRTSVVGCIAEDQLAGKVLFRIWPLSRITNFSGENK